MQRFGMPDRSSTSRSVPTAVVCSPAARTIPRGSGTRSTACNGCPRCSTTAPWSRPASRRRREPGRNGQAPTISGRVWDAHTGELLTPPLRHQGWGRVTDIAFNPLGDRVPTASLDGTAQIWNLSALDWPADDLQQLAELLGGHRIAADAGSLVPLDAPALRLRWESLRSRHPQAFGLSP